MGDRSRGSQCLEQEHQDYENDPLPVDPEMVQDLLFQLDSYKSLGADGIHPRILKELADVIAKPLLMAFEWSWEPEEVLANWKLVNVVLIFREGKKDSGNYRPVSLISVPGKVMEKIIVGKHNIENHLKDNAVIGHSQHGFMRGKSCLSNLISFYDKGKYTSLHLLRNGVEVTECDVSYCIDCSVGGAHEGLQHLGPYGNIPNIVAELTGDNVPKDFSEDQGYPDPPNPCPIGKTVDDGCLENTPDTAEFSREYQLHQHLFDPEHDYPNVGKWSKNLLFEKISGGSKRRKRSVNPYLQGQRLDNVVAKKSVPQFSDEDKGPE
ncbi:hypothetical protein WISP_94411 [Willisornis vidua]|uniref:Neuroendocrine protein 7B2 n=1 Tax=Willisornis vidua TaxID=1566151 RepID=A0ABQ9D4Y6_9PASS|nr:hypothetical protein WISP_94411 [Willisornis vidua]